jgi:hypothetical protein
MNKIESIAKIKAYTYLDIAMCKSLMNQLNTELNKDPNLWDLERNLNTILQSNNLAEIYQLNEKNYVIFDTCYWGDDRIERKVLTDWEARNIEIEVLSYNYVNQLVTVNI